MHSSSRGHDAPPVTALTFNAALEQVTTRLLRARAETVRAQICAGAMSYDQYKFHCGILKGLEYAEEDLAQALKDIQQAGRGE